MRDGDTRPLPVGQPAPIGRSKAGQALPRQGREDCEPCGGFGAIHHDGRIIARKDWNAALWTLGNLSICRYCTGTGYKPASLHWTPGRAGRFIWMEIALYVIFGGMALIALLALILL